MGPDTKKNGALPAFAHGLKSGAAYDGLTKREYIAAMALQGLLANKSIQKYTLWSAAQSAIMYADQLLECLDKDVRDDGTLAPPNDPPLPPLDAEEAA